MYNNFKDLIICKTEKSTKTLQQGIEQATSQNL